MSDERLQLEVAAAKVGIGAYTRHVFLCTGPNCCTTEAGMAAWEVLKRTAKEGKSLASETRDFAVFHVGVGDFGPAHAGVFEDAFVDEFLNVGDLLRRERRAVEVEGQLVRADE